VTRLAKKPRSPRKPTLLSVAKQARKAGIEVARYEIENGKIIVVVGKPHDTPAQTELDRELQDFEARNDQG